MIAVPGRRHTAIAPWAWGLAVILATQLCPVASAGFDTFEAVVGMDDEATHFPASSAFQVWLDDSLVLETGVMRPGDEPVAISVPLGSATRLRLAITDGGDTIRNDRGDWCDARLVDSRTGELVFLSDMPWRTLGEWIPARVDRTVTGNPLTLCGTVYCRGLGGFARMDYEWAGWNEHAARREAEARRLAALGAESCGGMIRLHLPDGVHVRAVADDAGEAGPTVQPLPLLSIGTRDLTSEYSLAIEVPGYDARSLRESAVGRSVIETARGYCRLADLVPDLIENPVQPSAAPPGAPVLAGRPYAGAEGCGATARFTYNALASKVAAVLSARGVSRDHVLRATVGLSPTSGPFGGTAELRVLDGEATVYYSGLLTARDEPVELEAPVSGVGSLTIVADAAGDGNLGDALAIVEPAVVVAHGDGVIRELDLSAHEPWIATTGWGEIGIGHGADGRALTLGGSQPARYARGFGVAADGSIAFRDLQAAVERCAAAAESLRGARLASDTREKRRLLQEATEADPRCVEAYLQLGELELGEGFVRRALWCGRRAVDRGGATRDQLARARDLLDRVYAQQYAAPTSPLTALRYGELATPVSSVLCVPQGDGGAPVAEGEARIPVSLSGRVRVTVLSRGVEVTARITSSSGKTVAEAGPCVDPDLAFEALEDVCSLVVEHDFARDGFDQPLEVLAVASPGNDRPAVEWLYRVAGDGTCEVEVRAGAPCVVPVPLTAERVRVTEGAGVLANVAATYGTALAAYDWQRPMLLVPRADADAILSFRWPDGACTLPRPMGRYAETSGKLWFHSIRMANEHARSVRVTLVPPEGAGETLEAEPVPRADIRGRTLVWDLGPRGFVRWVGQYDAATTPFIHREVGNMTVHVPRTAYYERYVGEFLDHLRDLYAVLETLVGGYSPEHALYVLVPNPVQLPGYGGATWGGDDYAESWVPVAGHIGEYPLRHRWNGLGIHSHELHWAFLGGVIPELPDWLRDTFSIYTEIAGNEALGHIGFDAWPRDQHYTGRAAWYSESPVTREGGTAFWSDEDLRGLSRDDKETVRAVRLMLARQLAARYGSRFWGELCRLARENRSDYAAASDERERTELAIEHMTQAAGDQWPRLLLESVGWTAGGFASSSQRHQAREGVSAGESKEIFAIPEPA